MKNSLKYIIFMSIFTIGLAVESGFTINSGVTYISGVQSYQFGELGIRKSYSSAIIEESGLKFEVLAPILENLLIGGCLGLNMRSLISSFIVKEESITHKHYDEKGNLLNKIYDEFGNLIDEKGLQEQKVISREALPGIYMNFSIPLLCSLKYDFAKPIDHMKLSLISRLGLNFILFTGVKDQIYNQYVLSKVDYIAELGLIFNYSTFHMELMIKSNFLGGYLSKGVYDSLTLTTASFYIGLGWINQEFS